MCMRGKLKEKKLKIIIKKKKMVILMTVLEATFAE